MPMLKRRWTVDDLHDLPDDGNRYEVIDGELLVTPAPAWKHQEAIAALYRTIAEYLSIHRVGHAVFAPADVVFSPKRGVQPDLFVVPLVDGRRPERFEDVGRLLLVVEVLSPSTARADRVAKRVLYRDQGVEQYWIVDPDSRTVELSIPTDSRVEVLADTIEWMPEGATQSLAIDLPDYFRRVLDG
ncbi:MAG: Uma2 family endonuclease [Gemmatimonadaceae bacterium]